MDALATAPGEPGKTNRRRRTPLLILATVLAAALVATLVWILQPWGGDDASVPTSCPAPTGPKAPLHGLLTVAGPVEGKADLPVAGYSINATWADLQPDPGGDIVRPNAVDRALEEFRQRRTSCEQGIKLRIFAGTNAPDWAKALGGGAVTMVHPGEDKDGTVPRFWTPEFGDAYTQLQAKLAEIYDGVAEIREIVISRCATFYAEPLLRQLQEEENEQALREAGLTEEDDRRCLREQVNAHEAWEWTPSSLALNPYARPDDQGRLRGTLAVPKAIARHCRTVLGARCILANNSIRHPSQSPLYDELYAFMEEQGPPLEFQAAAPARIGDPVRTLERAIGIGAGSIEMSPVLVGERDAELAPTVREWADQAPPTPRAGGGDQTDPGSESTEDGLTEDGMTEDGMTEDGMTGDGMTEDGMTGDGSGG